MTALLADIGGTYARLALLRQDAPPPSAHRFDLAGHAGVAALIAAWLARQPGPPPCRAVLAVAGPVEANRAVLTNRGWVADGAQLASALGLDSVRVINDFEALAWSLPHLPDAALLPLGGQPPGDPAAPMLVLGPGTGLGVGCLLRGPDRVLASEGGHAALAAHDAREAAVIEALRRRLGDHVSAERGALSGQGIENLHVALGGDPALPAAAIAEAGVGGTDPRCREVMALFCALLGAVAGNLALTFGARGGVFIGGGICPRFPEFLAASAFRARFEAKGRFADWLRPIPTWLIRDPDAAMLGLAALARQPPFPNGA
jgi:glucokinase